MTPADSDLIQTIDSIRMLHPDMQVLCMEGQCYAFHLVLRTLRPAAEAWYSRIEGHVYTRIAGRFYDIRGVRLAVPADTAPLDHRVGDKPHRWGLRDTRRFVEI